MNPQALMAILAALSQQGQGGQNQGLGPMPQISSQQTAPQAPPSPLVSGGNAQPTAAAPPMPMTPSAPPQGMGAMAQQALSNPQGQVIPQPPQMQQGGAHPLLAKIMAGLASGMQNVGYGMQTGPEQIQRQQMEAQKAESMARLAQEGSIREAQLGINQGKLENAQQNTKVAQQKADTLQDRVDAYKTLGEERNGIQKAALDVRKALGQGNIDLGYDRLAQQATQFQRSLDQHATQFNESLEFKNEVLNTGNALKESAQDIMRAAMQQGGAAKAAEIQQKAEAMGLGHWFQGMVMGNVPTPQASVQGALSSGMPGLPSSAPPTTGAPSPATATAPPAPKTKAQAKANQNKPKGGPKPLVEGVDF